MELSEKKYPDAEIYLYGTQARGDAKALSDWDLLILLNSENIPFSLETEIMDEFYNIELEVIQKGNHNTLKYKYFNENDWKNPIFETAMANKAYITPNVLKWARESARMSEETAAAKVSVTIEKLQEWENGKNQPTIRQAQILA